MRTSSKRSFFLPVIIASLSVLLLFPATVSEKISDAFIAHAEVDRNPKDLITDQKSIDNVENFDSRNNEWMQGSSSGAMISNSNSPVHGNQIRTATGGLINTLMIVLTVFACIGNGLFLIYVFWLSK